MVNIKKYYTEAEVKQAHREAQDRYKMKNKIKVRKASLRSYYKRKAEKLNDQNHL